MFRELFVREGFEFDFQYDWILKKQALKARLAANQRKQEEDRKQEEGEVKQRISQQL